MDSSILWTCAGIAALLGMSAFFSGSETALTAFNRATMHQLWARGSKGAGTALKLTEDNERLIGSILLGNNLVNILAASLATSMFTTAFGEAGVAWATPKTAADGVLQVNPEHACACSGARGER